MQRKVELRKKSIRELQLEILKNKSENADANVIASFGEDILMCLEAEQDEEFKKNNPTLR